jgi:DNA-binding SARP family transcriptional activator
VKFRILGPIEAEEDGLKLDLGGLRERALLARFLLSANRVVSADRLADDLWSGSPPPHSMATLRVYISRLRRALGARTDLLVTQAPGYWLDVTGDELDATRFENLVRTAEADLAAGRAESAAGLLRAALGLWRGPALSDVADLAFAQADAGRLEEARLAALESRVDADLACGWHAGLVAELDGLASAHPLRKRLTGQRILALYRCGRQAEALTAYATLRSRLAEELGIDPTPDLQRLHERILRQDPRLDWRPAAVQAVVGLSNWRLPTPQPALMTQNAAIRSAAKSAARRAGPDAASAGNPVIPNEIPPQEFQNTYDAAGTPTGARTAVALFTEGQVTGAITDLRTAETAFSLPQVPVSIVKVGPQSSDTAGADEWDLDTQSSSAMATTLKHIYLYNVGALNDTNIDTAIAAFVSQDKAVAMSASVAWPRSTSTPCTTR